MAEGENFTESLQHPGRTGFLPGSNWMQTHVVYKLLKKNLIVLNVNI